MKCNKCNLEFREYYLDKQRLCSACRGNLVVEAVPAKYIIKDWAGNTIHYTGALVGPTFAVPMEFETFDDAMEYLAIRFEYLDSNEAEYEAAIGEFHIEQLKQGEDK